MAEAEATPDQDTAIVDGQPLGDFGVFGIPGTGGGPAHDGPGPSPPEARAFWEGRDPASARASPRLVDAAPDPEEDWDSLTTYLAELDAAEGAQATSAAVPVLAAAKPKTVAKAPPPPFL